MKRSELRNFDIVETKSGYLFMVCADDGVLFRKEGWVDLDNYDDDLTLLNFDEDYDIVKVRRPEHKYQYWRYGQIDAPVIWERNKKKPKLSHEEKVILRALNKPEWWIARDWYGLYVYKEKPVFEREWRRGGELVSMTLYDHLFDLVEKDKDCYQVKDLIGEAQ